jgi:gliding motility-associated lipoprotein GldH
MHNCLLIFFSIILLSCGNNTYEDYHSFKYKRWNTDSIVSFKYTILDTTIKYDLSLSIRHSVDYEFQNLFIFLEETHKDTIEIILANKSGKWIGSGISDIREVKYNFDNERIFAKKGEYMLSIEQAMRYGSQAKIENLEHILDVGLIVAKHNE